MPPLKLGTANWLDPRGVEDQYEFEDGAIWLGRTVNRVPIGYRDDQHVAAICRTRGGKGTTIILPTLLTYRGSIVVMDPKGENATISARRRGKGSKYAYGLQQTVHVLDPFHVASVPDYMRSRFNPLETLDAENEETIDEAARIADALVIVREDSQDPYWEEAARDMVKTLILHIVTDPQFEGRRNLITLRRLLARGDYEGVEALRAAGETKIPSAQQMLWMNVALNPAFDGVIAGGGDGFYNMCQNSEKAFDGVLQSALRHTEFLDSPAMQRVLETSDFELSDLKTDPKGVSLYLSLPQRYMNTHHRWLRMMVALTITEMEKTKRPKGEDIRALKLAGKLTPLTLPILMVLDEFAGLQRMPMIENAVAQIAGYEVKLFFILQSLEQLKAVYKDKWETFLGNCGVKVFFNVEDHFSREYASKLIGETEVIRETGSRNETTGETDSNTRGTNQSVSLTDSWNRATSQSTNTSRSESRTRGTGSSVTAGENSSETEGLSKGENSSYTSTISRNKNTSYTFGGGISRTENYSQIPVRPTSTSVTDSFNHSSTNSTGEGSSTAYGTGKSTQSSTSKTTGKQTGRSVSSNDSHQEGTATSVNDGTSDSSGGSRGTTTGTNESETRGTSYTFTVGVQDTLHHRPLIHPDEIGRLFASIDDRRNGAFPGLALVLLAGKRPLVVRRTNYFSDANFMLRFDPHPDHPTQSILTIKAWKEEEQRRLTAKQEAAKEIARTKAEDAARDPYGLDGLSLAELWQRSRPEKETFPFCLTNGAGRRPINPNYDFTKRRDRYAPPPSSLGARFKEWIKGKIFRS